MAKSCVRKGVAVLLMLNRPSERATKAEEEVKAEILDGSNTVVETIACDLQDLENVRECATKIKSKYEAIDVLCCNAGVMVSSPSRRNDEISHSIIP